MVYAISEETLEKYRTKIWDTLDHRPETVDQRVRTVLNLSQSLPGCVQTHSGLGDDGPCMTVAFTYRATLDGESTLRSMLAELIDECLRAELPLPKMISEIDQLGTTDKVQRYALSHRIIWTARRRHDEEQRDRYLAIHRKVVGSHADFRLRADVVGL